MKKKVGLGILIVVLAAFAVYVIILLCRPVKPLVEENGNINGEYSLESIMSLKSPYKCSFTKTENDAGVAGTILTDGKSAYGEIRVLTNAVQNEFNSFFVVKDGKAFVWTSLYPVGYKTHAAKSASKNASPSEQ